MIATAQNAVLQMHMT